MNEKQQHAAPAEYLAGIDTEAWKARLKAKRTRWQYEQLHHLARLEAYLDRWANVAHVPIVAQALTHQRNLIRMEISDYPAWMRDAVREAMGWQKETRFAVNKLGSPQLHSANFGKYLFEVGNRHDMNAKGIYEVRS